MLFNIHTSTFIQKITITICALTYILSSNCSDIDDGRNDAVLYFYYKGHVIDQSSGKILSGLIVMCDNPTRTESVDTSRNGSFSVYDALNTDHHSAKHDQSWLSAYNCEFFGDTFVIFPKSNDTLIVDIYVKPVGVVVLSLHQLINIKNINVSISDGENAFGPRHVTAYHFCPSKTDTTVILPAHPGLSNYIDCYFNKSTANETWYHNVVSVASRDTLVLNVTP
jgi:hypothetical protein